MNKHVVLADGVEMYCGDCLDILPDIADFDALLTDPPYALGDWNDRGANAKRRFNGAETAAWDKPITHAHIEMMISKTKYQIIWGWNYFSDLLPRSKQMLVWNKCVRGMHFNDCEIAWCSQFKEASRVFDFFPASAERKEHHTQKPVELIKWCIERLPADAKTILDPFAGAGTTGVAAVAMGRKFVGIEMQPKFFDLSCRRIERALRQPDLFVELPAPALQLPLSL